MSYKIIPTSLFQKETKKLSKKYPLIKDDIKGLCNRLKENPIQGDSLGKGCYKIRMKITGKKAGKSGGARVIINVEILDNEIYLLSIYDKSGKESLEENELDKLLKGL